ncbi:MAG: hypothetical protein DRN04_05715 [Thermoprotei archaeon]|nr:MAG: hypothetical protein DRN04_05715 [Thermoprotei archaeon]
MAMPWRLVTKSLVLRSALFKSITSRTTSLEVFLKKKTINADKIITITIRVVNLRKFIKLN